MEKKLEEMIDEDGLEFVLTALGNVCSEKADHIVNNWQDRGLAAKWERAAKACYRLASSKTIRGISK